MPGVRDGQGRYCVLLNRGQLRHNGRRRILSPIGGELEVCPSGQRYLTSLGAADFEDGDDLRFRVPDNQVRTVIDWFNRRTDREVTVQRELAEELTRETDALDAMDVVSAREQFSGFFRYDATTPRQNVPERRTVYLIEVFDVWLGRKAMTKLLAASRQPVFQRWVHFVTRRKLVAGRSNDGETIGPIARFIL